MKNTNYVIKLYTGNTYAKSRRNNFIFGCAMAGKRGKTDDVISRSHEGLMFPKLSETFRKIPKLSESFG